MKSDFTTPKYKRDSMPDKKAFPENKMKNPAELTRRNVGVAGGSVAPLDLTVKHWDKDTRTYSNNETERAAQGRTTSPPMTAPKNTPNDLGDLLHSMGSGFKKGEK